MGKFLTKEQDEVRVMRDEASLKRIESYEEHKYGSYNPSESQRRVYAENFDEIQRRKLAIQRKWEELVEVVE